MGKTEHLKKYQFTSENQPANKGRKKNLYNRLKESDISKDDIINVFKTVLEKSPKELKKDFEKVKTMEAIQTTKDKPMLYYIIVSALFRDLKRGSLYNVESILSRWLGNPRQAIDMSGSILNVESFDVKLSDEEKAEYEQRLKESLGFKKDD